MLRKFLCLALFAATCATANAGVTGSALLELRNIVVKKAGGTVMTGTSVKGVADIRVQSISTDARVSTSLTGYASDGDAGILNVIGDLPIPPIVSFVGNNPATASSGVAGDMINASAEFGGSFVNLSADPLGMAPYSFATGGYALTEADFDVSTFGLEGLGNSNVTSTSKFVFTATGTQTVTLYI